MSSLTSRYALQSVDTEKLWRSLQSVDPKKLSLQNLDPKKLWISFMDGICCIHQYTFDSNFYDKICKNKGYSSDDATEGESDSDDDYTVDASHFGNSVLEVAPVTSNVSSKCEKDHDEEESTVVESAIENKLSTEVMDKVDEIVSSHLKNDTEDFYDCDEPDMGLLASSSKTNEASFETSSTTDSTNTSKQTDIEYYGPHRHVLTGSTNVLKSINDLASRLSAKYTSPDRFEDEKSELCSMNEQEEASCPSMSSAQVKQFKSLLGDSEEDDFETSSALYQSEATDEVGDDQVRRLKSLMDETGENIDNQIDDFKSLLSETDDCNGVNSALSPSKVSKNAEDEQESKLSVSFVDQEDVSKNDEDEKESKISLPSSTPDQDEKSEMTLKYEWEYEQYKKRKRNYKVLSKKKRQSMKKSILKNDDEELDNTTEFAITTAVVDYFTFKIAMNCFDLIGRRNNFRFTSEKYDDTGTVATYGTFGTLLTSSGMSAFRDTFNGIVFNPFGLGGVPEEDSQIS